MTTEKKHLKGIGGWLILLIILLFWDVLSYLQMILSNLGIIGKPDLSAFAELGITVRELNPSLELLAISLLVVLYVIALIFLFKQKKSAPAVTLITIWTSYVLGTLMSLYQVLLVGIVLAIIGLIPAVLWTLYFKKSVRVKQTFVK